MPLRLLKFALSKKHPEPPMFRHHDRLKSNYDAVIIGGGGHGLATAYYLARDYGMNNIAVLEKGYIGGGNTGRNTTIIRSNYLTPEGVKFYDESVRLWQDLAQDFDLNLFYSTRGHFTLAHTDSAVRTMRWRAEVNKHFGIDSELVAPDEIQKACPHMDLSCGGNAPVMGALYHAPGSIARHDAVAWGYGRGADRRGVEIHQQTEVLGINIKSGKVTGVQTTGGNISTPRVLCAVAGFTPRILQMLGLRSPLYIHPLQAMVSEPMKPWLDPIVVSGSLHIYVSQTARGELVMGASLDTYELHSTRSTLEFVEELAAHMLELFPFLSHVKVVRQWAG
ncbi:MAG: FAD-dependent oxidoreductase, partial [Microcoleus sp. T3-bin5]|nr:FAD-dependent oxidoreductase [Microcoleus sp. T3-bin5]